MNNFTHVTAIATIFFALSGIAGCTAAETVDDGPVPPLVLLQETPVGIVMLPGGAYAFFNVEHPGADVVLPTPDGRRVTLRPKVDFDIPPGHYGRRLLLDPDGELHEVYTKARGKGRPAVGLFIDLWHNKTTGKRARWQEPKMIWRGYIGALMEYRQLSSGRIVAPFGKWIANRPIAPPTGANVVTAVYSDDDGETWHESKSELTSPCYEGYNGNNYGACEPTIVELGNGRIYMLMRTQTGFLYESWSDDGAEWSKAAPSRFHASTSPPGLLKLPDGRIVLFWNNCEMPPRIDGAGVYGGRDALHAAISDDDGRTWRGFREIYRDLYRNETPPKRGDRGTAYPYGVYDEDGNILVLSGQGKGRRNFIRIAPDWLTMTYREDDFSHGLDGWHVFKPFGPAAGYWRDRTVGPRLVNHPDRQGAKALQIRRPDEKDPDGATWNFPLGWKGRLSLRILLNRGFGGASIALGDRMFEPTDDNGERLAIFRLTVDPHGKMNTGGRLQLGVWHTVELHWNLDAAVCRLRVDGKEIGELQQAHLTGNGISYLRLRSTAAKIDRAGFLVDHVRADISDPVAPPRTAEQNRDMAKRYLKLLEGHRNKQTSPQPPPEPGGEKDNRVPAPVG